MVGRRFTGGARSKLLLMLEMAVRLVPWRISRIFAPDPLRGLKDIIQEGDDGADTLRGKASRSDYVMLRRRIESYIAAHTAKRWHRPRWLRRHRKRDKKGEQQLIDPFIVLPPEIVQIVLEYCPSESIAMAASVCKAWRTFCYDTLLWQHKIITDRIYTAFKLPILGTEWREIYGKKQLMCNSFRYFEFGTVVCQRYVDVILSDSLMLTLNGNHLIDEVRIWDLSTDRPYDIEGYLGVTFREFSRDITLDHTIDITSGNLDNEQVVLGFSNGDIAIVQLRTSSVRRLSAHFGYVWQIRFTDKYIVTRGHDYRITIIDRYNNNTPIAHITCPCDPICMEVAGNTVYVTTGNTGLLAWNIETLEKVRTGCPITSNLLTCTTLHRVICGTRQWGTVKAWDLETRRLECNLRFPGQLVYSIYDHIVAVGDEYNVEFYDILMNRTLVRVNLKKYHGFGEDFQVEQVKFNLKFGLLALKNGFIMVLDFRDPEIEDAFYKYLMP